MLVYWYEGKCQTRDTGAKLLAISSVPEASAVGKGIYNSLSALGGQTPTVGSCGLSQICPVPIAHLPVLPIPLTVASFISPLQLAELSSLIRFTGLKRRGLCRAIGGTSLLVRETASLAMAELRSFYPHLLPFLPRAPHAPWDFIPCILCVAGNWQRLILLAALKG